MSINWQPRLENDLLILQPLSAIYFEELFQVASDPLIWDQHPSKERSHPKGFELFFKEALESNRAFIVIDKGSGTTIGSTRFAPVNETTNAIEIGWTFLARGYWGGRHNRSMKMMMIDYAFKYVDHVLFYIHQDNIRSQKSVEKIGGKRIERLDNLVLASRPNATVIYAIHKTDRIG
jgi:RimJ/RimL family protein N-acetyltransferase